MGKTETGVPEKVNRFLTNIFSTIDKLNLFKIFTAGVKGKDNYVILGNQLKKCIKYFCLERTFSRGGRWRLH